MFTRLWKAKGILFCIILLSAFLRFYDLNWDQNQHLHPDERFLTMVATAMKVPASFGEYMSPQLSSMNPANTGNAFYVYGTFPVVLDKLFALAIGADNYNDITLLGRLLSGFPDILVVFLVYKTVELFEKQDKIAKPVKYWAAFFYAIAVLPIQLSHFFAVDTFLNLYAFAAVYFAIRFSTAKQYWFVVLSAVAFGLAIGSKISAIYIAPLIVFFILKNDLPNRHHKKFNFVNILYSLIIFGLGTYIIGRIADPYLFQTGNFFDVQISQLFKDNIAALKSWSTPTAMFPPSVQWVHKLPIIFPLTNLVLLGIGIGYTLLIALGLAFIFRKYRHIDFMAILLWMLLFFIYQGVQFSTTMRYFITLYPFLAIIAAIGFYEIARGWDMWKKIALLIPVIIWPIMFFSIYTQIHTRNTASQWIYQNIPNGYTLLSEHWDDSLPLATNPPSAKTYVYEQLPVFDPDSTDKWNKMYSLLHKGDYLVLSSNRGWGSIPTVPERYPQMTQFYDKLFAGKTQYRKVAEFTSYPSLKYLGLPITLSDDWAEEAFTVYDHPKVMIFENTAK